MKKIQILLGFLILCSWLFAQTLEEKAMDNVAREIYNRMASERKISCIMIKCAADASDAEIENAQNKISKARMRVVNYSENFNAVAIEISDFPNSVDQGWITPFSHKKVFLDAAYETPVGQISKIYRADFGFFILKVNEEQPHEEVHARHLLIRLNDKTNEELVKSRVDSIYKVLKSSPDKFEKLAKIYSEDGVTKTKGGDLGWFARRRMPIEIEDVAFSLSNGSISQPFRSQWGWHILQTIEKRRLQPYEAIKAEICQKIQGNNDYMREVNDFIAMNKTKTISRDFASLEIVNNTISFYDKSNDNIINANESGHILFKVKNTGQGIATGCFVSIDIDGAKDGILIDQTQKIKDISPAESIDIDIPFKTNISTKEGIATFKVEVIESNGFGTDPIEISVKTHAYEPPLLQIVDYAITGTTGAKLIKKQPFNLQLMLQNTKYGNADNVEVELELPENVFLLEGSKYISIDGLEGGKAKSIDYQIIINNNYSGNDIPIQVYVKEKYGKFAENKKINLQLNQDMASTRLTVKAAEQELENRGEIHIATIGSAIDKNIPISQQQNKTTFAVIIANENYQQVAKVPFALNDGNIFKQYCEKTLGIPSQNIHFVGDATINNIKQQVNWLSQVMNAYNGKARVIFYYAGHGVPDEKSKTAFLLPIDGNGSDITTGYKLDDLYSILGSIPSQSVTIFLDACFSGSKREEGMLASARGVAIKVNKGQPTGNMVVFSAASGDETAYPNYEEGHGMFTYYLLKKIQETKGDVTYEELGNYIRQNVAQQSIVLNGKSQTPTITASPSVTDWQNWKLK